MELSLGNLNSFALDGAVILYGFLSTPVVHYFYNLLKERVRMVYMGVFPLFNSKVNQSKLNKSHVHDIKLLKPNKNTAKAI